MADRIDLVSASKVDRWFRVFVPSMGSVPPRFGFAYRCWDRDGAMAYRMPFNLVVRWWIIHVYLRVKNPVTGNGSDAATLTAFAVYQRGHKDGYQQAVRDIVGFMKAPDIELLRQSIEQKPGELAQFKQKLFSEWSI